MFRSMLGYNTLARKAFTPLASRQFSTTSITRNTNLDFSNIVASSTNPTNIHTPSSSSFSGIREIVHKYVLYCNFTKNNTHFTYTAVTEDLDFLKKNPDLSYNEQVLYYYQLPQKVKISLSTGQLGFRKSARGEYEASFQTAAKMFALIQEKGLLDKSIEIVVKNFGKGREAFIDALKGKEGNQIRGKVVKISDNTKLKFGGTRSPKARRL